MRLHCPDKTWVGIARISDTTLQGCCTVENDLICPSPAPPHTRQQPAAASKFPQNPGTSFSEPPQPFLAKAYRLPLLVALRVGSLHGPSLWLLHWNGAILPGLPRSKCMRFSASLLLLCSWQVWLAQGLFVAFLHTWARRSALFAGWDVCYVVRIQSFSLHWSRTAACHYRLLGVEGSRSQGEDRSSTSS